MAELPWDEGEVKVECLTPRVHVHYASSISGLKGVANKNVILHKMRKSVKYVKSYDGDTRICIVDEKFENHDKLQIQEGILFVVSDPLTAKEHGLHLLVYPVATTDSADLTVLQRNLARQANLDEITAYLKPAPSWIAASFWKQMGEEGRGRIEVRPPSTKVTIFTPSDKQYSPEPGMVEFVEKGVANLWGELALDTKHPAYKRMSEMR
jgi:hypothetical protein